MFHEFTSTTELNRWFDGLAEAHGDRIRAEGYPFAASTVVGNVTMVEGEPAGVFALTPFEFELRVDEPNTGHLDPGPKTEMQLERVDPFSIVLHTDVPIPFKKHRIIEMAKYVVKVELRKRLEP